MTASLPHHLRRTLALGLPLVGSQVAQILVGLTDTLMLGWYAVPALAAGVLGSSFFFSVYVLGAGFGYAVMPVAAEAAARGDEVRVRRAARMGLWLSLGFALLILPLFVWSAAVLRALGQEAALADDAQTYLRIAGLGLIPALLVTTLRSHLSALERTRIVLWSTLLAALANVPLNWLLIFGNWGAPELGLAGAAIASVAVQAIMLAVLLIYALRGPGMARFDLLRNIHRPDWPALREVAALGWPIGLTHLAESSLFVGAAVMMGWLGTVPLAAHGIAVQIAGLTFMVHMGLSQAATVRVGRAWGEGDAAGMRRAALAASLLSGVAVALAVALYFGAGPWIVGSFVDPTDPKAPAILAMGTMLLAYAALFQTVDAGQVMALGIPAGYLLGVALGLGPAGIWLGLTVGLGAAAALMGGRFWRRMRALHGEGHAATAR